MKCEGGLLDLDNKPRYHILYSITKGKRQIPQLRGFRLVKRPLLNITFVPLNITSTISYCKSGTIVDVLSLVTFV